MSSSTTATTGLIGEQPLTSTGGTLPHSDPHTAIPTSSSSIAVQDGVEAVGSELPGIGASSDVVTGGSDQQILRQHELALQRLEELQGDMIGGEKGGRPLACM